jgi:multidrug efflux system membrane fusion protein
MPVIVVRTYVPDSGPELAVIDNALPPGDLVVTEGQLRLTAGAPVSLLNAPPGAAKQARDENSTSAP